MVVHIISFICILSTIGVCFCTDEYYGVAHKDFQVICVALALPGRSNGPDPDTFNTTWNKYLGIGRQKIFQSRDVNESLNAAKDHCRGDEPETDSQCAYFDLVNIGNLVNEDVRELQSTIRTAATPFNTSWWYYTHYIAAWFQHPRIIKLNCGPTQEYLWLFLAKLSHLDSYEMALHMKSIFDKVNAKGLRQEIERSCSDAATKPICEMKTWTNTADKVEKLLAIVGKSGWNSSANIVFKHSIYLHFYSVKIKISRFYSGHVNFLSTNRTDVRSWIESVVIYFYDSLRNSKAEDLAKVLELLPESYDLPCVNTAKFPSFERTMCMFKWTIQLLKHFVQRHQIPYFSKLTAKSRTLISTHIDYKSFLNQKRLEQIMNIGQNTQTNLIYVANSLKLEIKKGFGQVKSYFQVVAKFDSDIAKSDIQSISKDIDNYREESTLLANTLRHRMTGLITASIAAAGFDLAEAIVSLALTIAERCNPFAILFGTSSATDVFEATQKVSNAISHLTKATKMKESFDLLKTESQAFNTKLNKNQEFWINVRALIGNLSNDISSIHVEKEKELFLNKYRVYSPAASKEDLASLRAAWEGLVDEACNLLDSTSGLAGGVAKSVEAGIRTCPQAKVEVQKLMTVYEEIYDFQFDLIAALASNMRALTSFQAASKINEDFDEDKLQNKNDKDTLSNIQLLTEFSMIHYKISLIEATESFCNVLEYQEGHRPQECSGIGTTITALLTRRQTKCQREVLFQLVRTKPSKPGDKAFVNLQELYAGENVLFKIPDAQWLIDNEWIVNTARNNIFFVERFELYLPTVSSIQTKVQVEATARGANQLRPPNGTVYVISPRQTLWFDYQEGHRGLPCHQSEINNPFNDACRRLPGICPVSKDLPHLQTVVPIYPSLFAQWNIKLHGYANLTLPETDVHIPVGLHLCVINNIPKSKRSVHDSPLINRTHNTMGKHVNQSNNLPRRRRSMNTSACCGQNEYSGPPTYTCKPCPAGSESMFNGLFCGNTTRLVLAPAKQYYFTFEEARLQCEKEGTVIASPEDIQKAIKLGYDACACGWLSDGSVVAPNPTAICRENGGKSTLTCTGRSRWDVYCINKF